MNCANNPKPTKPIAADCGGKCRMPSHAGPFARLRSLRSGPAPVSGRLNPLPGMSKSYRCTCDDPRARLTGEPCPVHLVAPGQANR